MKRFILTFALVLLLLACSLCFGTAAGFSEAGIVSDPPPSSNVWQSLLVVLAPLVVTILTPLGVRLFKKMGIDIEDSIVGSLLMQIINIITRIEMKYKDASGAEKFKIVAETIHRDLSADKIATLARKFGSLDAAIEAAFQSSHLAGKR